MLKTRHRVALLAATTLLGLASAGAQTPAPTAASTIIDGVTIVDPRDGSLRRNVTILIRDGKIATIGRAGSITEDGANRINARGKFVVPGFNDMHAHPLNSTGPDISLPLMVANGITGYRQMAGADALLRARRAGKLPMPAIAPQLLATPGMVLAGAIAGNPQAAVAEVQKQIAEGADFIKVVDLGPPAFFAAMDAATAAGRKFVGHLPSTIDVREAARRGMDGIEHLGPNAALLEACSTDETAIRAGYAEAAASGGKIRFDLPPAALKRMTANPTLLIDAAGFAQLQHIVETYDEGKCRTLARDLAKTGLWQVPTLIRIKTMDFGDATEFRDNPNLRYMTAGDRRMWQEVAQMFSARITPANRATLAAVYAKQLHLLKLFDQAGVKLLAGTDFGGQWIVPGFSLHQEFDLLAGAGLSPLRVLQMTTIDAARFLDREATMGTVEVGKTADLVLLDANPVADVRNLHGIAAVVRGGHYLARGDLDAIKT